MKNQACCRCTDVPLGHWTICCGDCSGAPSCARRQGRMCRCCQSGVIWRQSIAVAARSRLPCHILLPQPAWVCCAWCELQRCRVCSECMLAASAGSRSALQSAAQNGLARDFSLIYQHKLCLCRRHSRAHRRAQSPGWPVCVRCWHAQGMMQRGPAGPACRQANVELTAVGRPGGDQKCDAGPKNQSYPLTHPEIY